MISVAYKKLNFNRKFGIELEVGKEVSQEILANSIRKHTKREVEVYKEWHGSASNSVWHVKFDRSCGVTRGEGEHGWEIASFVGESLEDLNEITAVTRELSGSGAQVSNNCGFHIHVSTDGFDRVQLAHVVAQWLKIEQLAMQMVPAHRAENDYCRALTQLRKFDKEKQYSEGQLYLLYKPSDMHYHENPERHWALNIVNCVGNILGMSWYERRNTIELRIPEGTLDEVVVRNWIKFFLRFVQISRLMPMPKTLRSYVDIDDLLRMLRLEGGQTHLILDPELLSLKVWILERLVQFGKPKIRAAANKKLAFLRP